jgi:diguanylate cyclase (GGDEF)-like protein/PAS domain S-box-containing protein
MSDISGQRSTATRGHPLQAYMIALALVAGVPAFALAGLAVWQGVEAQRTASLARLLDTSHALAQAVESELENHATLLRTLAAALAIDRSNGAQIPSLLKEAGLGERSQVHSETIELGSTPLPAFTAQGVPRGAIEETLRTGAPAVSNLYRPAPDAAVRIAIVMAQGMPSAMPRLLSLVLPPEQLVRSARPDPSVPATLLVAVTDGSGHIVARSRDATRYIGKPVPDWTKLQALGTDDGVFEATTTEGRQVIFAFQKLRNTPGWVLVVGEPLSDFNARWTGPLRQLLLGGAVVLLGALLLAVWLGRRIVLPVQRLAVHARAVAAGEVTPQTARATAPLRIREWEALHDALQASEHFLRRAAELERRNAEVLALSERRYRRFSEAGASTLWRADAHRAITAAAGWEKLTGEDEALALGFNWLKRVHPEDRHLIEEAAGPDPNLLDHGDVEFRLRDHADQWRWVRSRAAAIRDDAGQVVEWIGVIEDIDERRRDQARIAHMAMHDALTGLPNRIRFWQRLEEAIARAGRGEGAALLSIDLDRFKQVNDALGHPVGDALLQAVTQRLKALVRDTDTVARLGGDEFAVVQSQVRAPSEATDLALRIIHALGTPFELSGHKVQIGASVGVVLVHAGSDAETLARQADAALYYAKHQGRGRHALYDASQMPV